MTSNQHKTKKGLDIRIPGIADKSEPIEIVADEYAVKPTDYVGVAPRMLVAEGDNVMAGSPLFEDKNNEGIPFVSPVSGTVKAVVRGEKRALLAVVIKASGIRQSVTYNTIDPTIADADTLRQQMVSSGLWNLLRERPFGIVPRKESRPKAVFISAFDSSPLPVDIDFILKGREDDFQYGISILAKIVGRVCLSLDCNTQRNSILASTKDAEIHFFEGPHPAGLVGTQISAISPINKGESVWTVSAQDVAVIGHLFRTGEYSPEKTVALCGPGAKNPRYYKLIEGSSIQPMIGNMQDGVRIICGDVLSGISVNPDGYLCCHCDKISVIPEGDYYDFLGWLRPNFRKFSFSGLFMSGLLSKIGIKKIPVDFDTNRHGSQRPLFVTGEFEKLVPLDIYPMQLIKACIVGDIELMENLGIYEVEPEDLALCEFADTSKTEIQAIIREGLEKIRKELGL